MLSVGWGGRLGAHLRCYSSLDLKCVFVTAPRDMGYERYGVGDSALTCGVLHSLSGGRWRDVLREREFCLVL